MDRTLGSLLNELLDTLDAGVQRVYHDAGLDYRPRYTPVMRVLSRDGPSTITQIARHAPLTHSAASQTVAQMARQGLITSQPGKDARERVIALSPAGEALMPELRAWWAASEAAVYALGEEIGTPLHAVLASALEVLKRQPFHERIVEARAAQAREVAA